jgi:cytidylate kinase
MVVTLDGPAGVGKSSIAARVGRETGFQYLNSGSFYRAISQAVLDSGQDPTRRDLVLEEARRGRFSINGGELWLNGRPTRGLQSDLIDRWSPVHSGIPELRAIVNENLRAIARAGNFIVEGRDMGTVAFPDAELKIFLDASLEARASRRFAQGVSGLSREELRQSIAERDKLDRNKPVGRLERAADALYLDTSDLTIEEVCAKVVKEIRKRQSTGSQYNELRTEEKS